MSQLIRELARALGVGEAEVGLVLIFAGLLLIGAVVVAFFWGRGPGGR